MKTGTRIAVVLDRSQSMNQILNGTINGFNEFISGQKNEEGEARLTLAQFNDYYEIVHNDIDIQKVPELTRQTYCPSGMTALYDAVCKTIKALNEEEACSHCSAEKTVFVIITDGEENRSREYTYEQMTKMISHQQKRHGWEFVFIGANQDAMETAKRFHIPMANSMTYAAHDVGTQSVFRGMSKNLGNLRKGVAENMSYSVVDRAEQDAANKGQVR